MQKRFAVIKEHFENEAAVFDKLFFKVAPRYEEMMQALVDALPFKRSEKVRIIDLGCGTGNLSKKLITTYPRAHITCIDMAENMLTMARAKLQGHRGITFWQGDIRDFDYRGEYDLIVASLVLHHVEGKEKLRFYRKMHAALSRNGTFLCIDIFLSPSSHLQQVHMDKWKAFMRENGLPAKKIDEMIFRHQDEDRPVALTDELVLLHKAGFRGVDVILKHYNFALYGGCA